MPSPSPAARRSRGFTLLEVLAAVAIFGIWYVALAGASLQGLRGEGESDRRLAASLLADQVLADMEAPMSLGVAPEIGNQEYEQDGYVVRTEVTPFDPLPLIPPPPQPPGRPPPATSSAPASSLLAAAAAGGASPLRQVRVQVAWTEGAGERSVWRTTFALDLQGAQAALGALGALPSEGGTP
jgi:prepilin-type N-terminal cleavage/methylation domain-containing protein